MGASVQGTPQGAPLASSVGDADRPRDRPLTHAVESLGAARRVLYLYRRRWIIEEFFRTLKTAGFDIEAAETDVLAFMSFP